MLCRCLVRIGLSITTSISKHTDTRCQLLKFMINLVRYVNVLLKSLCSITWLSQYTHLTTCTQVNLFYMGPTRQFIYTGQFICRAILMFGSLLLESITWLHQFLRILDLKFWLNHNPTFSLILWKKYQLPQHLRV